MSQHNGSLKDLTDKIYAINPEYLNLFTAESDTEFESAFSSLLKVAIENLETNSKNYKALDENGLSAAIAAGMTMPGLNVTQEANSNGHVDITIRADFCTPPRKKLAEAKIYDGFKYHVKGLKQLLGYMTGRDSDGLMLIYVRKKSIATLISKLGEKMNIELPLNQQGQVYDHELKWAFNSNHTHESGEVVKIGHVACNLNVP